MTWPLPKPIVRIIIVAGAVVVLVLNWPLMGWLSIPFAVVVAVLLIAADNSNRLRKK